MKVDWTSESDDEGTIFVRIYPKDQAERELITSALLDVLTDEPQPATLYAESDTSKFIYGVTDDPEGRTTTRNGEDPIVMINVFRRSK